MADNHTIARPYAQAVFELARDAGELAAWAASLEVAGQLTADGEVAAFLANPKFSNERRLEFLTGLFENAQDALLSGSDTRGSNFLRLLVENRRIGVLPEIAEHFEALKAVVERRVDVVVVSASPLSAAQEREIVNALETRFARDVRIETRIDENLIGGAVVRAGDVVIDGSLRARLDGLTNALIN